MLFHSVQALVHSFTFAASEHRVLCDMSSAEPSCDSGKAG